MIIALAQINFIVGDFEYNSTKIIKAITESKKVNADLIVFSELAICGYSPFDLLESKDFIDKSYNAINIIAKYSEDIGVIIGAPTINEGTGKMLFNSAMFIHDNKIQKIVNKTLLPTYDIFDEYRYFESNNEFDIIEFKGKKIALTICEDLWDEQEKNLDFDKETIYRNSPMQALTKLKPDFIVNIAGSPFSYNQAETRKNILVKNAIKYNLPIIYVNQVGANTDLIFDGGSAVFNYRGEVILSCKYFEEDIRLINTNKISELPEIIETRNKYADINSALVLGLKDYFLKSKFSKAVIGLSGGIDSAICVAIAVQALGNKNVEAILMPTKYSSKHSISDSIDMIERCNISSHKINIEKLRKQFDNTFENLFENISPDTTEENIQARIRGTILMAYSNKFGNIVINTSNKSEAAVGYTTLYGDMNGALSLIGDVYKTDVYKLARYINENIAPIIPDNIINKEPSAELRFDQKDSDSLPQYEILDGILFNYIEKKLSASEIIALGYHSSTVDYILSLVNYSEYKRFQAPPILRISSKAFGFGRRMPLVAKY
jgi:NAD+ synthase (glutamine-hydrolysing)